MRDVQKQGGVIGAAVAVCSVTAAGAIIDGDNLVLNGGFESTEMDRTWALFDSIEGWTSSDSTSIEIQRGVNGWVAAEGAQYVELDSTSREGGHGIYQDVGTDIGAAYDLSVMFSARPGVLDNRLMVYWDGALIGEFFDSGSGKGNTEWQRIDLEVVAAGDTSRLEFRNGDRGDSLGTFIDGVSLTRGVPAPGGVTLFALSAVVVIRRRRM